MRASIALLQAGKSFLDGLDLSLSFENHCNNLKTKRNIAFLILLQVSQKNETPCTQKDTRKKKKRHVFFCLAIIYIRKDFTKHSLIWHICSVLLMHHIFW